MSVLTSRLKELLTHYLGPERLSCSRLETKSALSLKGPTVLLGFTLAWVCQAAPSIEITNVPAFGSLNNLGGRVLNASPAAYRVAIFIYVPSAGWYSKPYCDPQLTTIQPDTSWTADVTTGGSDQLATKFAA